MPSNFDQYRVKVGDQIGDPEYWNAPRFKDLDRRINSLEDQKTTLDAVIEEGRTVFRARVDEILLPLVQEVYEIAQVGVMLRAHSATEIEISLGGKTLFIDEDEKNRFAAPSYVSVMANGDPSRALFATVISYDLDTGELVIDVDRFVGAGNGADWIVTVANTTDGVNDANRAEIAANEALLHRTQAQTARTDAQAAAATATTQRDSAVLANTQAQAAKTDAQTYRGDVISAIANWTAAVLPPSSFDPLTRPGGAALQIGDQFFKTTDSKWRTWNGVQWTINAVPIGSQVDSVFGRTGSVSAQANDYRGDQIARTNTQQTIIAGANVEAALQTVSNAVAAESTARATEITTAVTPKADKTTSISAAGLATGGGDLSANRTITVPKSSQAQAQAGTDDATAMTPVRVKDAIDTLVPAASETMAGKARFATTVEVSAGTSTTIAVNPAGLKAALDSRISSLVNGAGAALDTLSELATALGNDANFSATVATALAGKAPLNGTGATGTWAISISGTAAFANSVAWANVTGRPTALSSFTNDPGYITTAGRAFPRKADGTNFNLNWSGQAGQPAWLVGSNDGTEFYVWNPSNFSVNYAASAGNAATLAGRTPTTFGLDRLTDANAAAARAGIDAPSRGGADASGTWSINVTGYAGGLWNSPGAAPHYSCRAWVNLNGANGAIRASGNVSSVTRLGAGIYAVNFATAMPDTNYSIVAGISQHNGNFAAVLSINTNENYADSAPTTSSFRLFVVVPGYSGGRDVTYISAAVFR